MHSKIVEVTNGQCNWGKFWVGVLDEKELSRPSAVDIGTTLAHSRGWNPRNFWLLDLETREGACFRHRGNDQYDLKKHAIWVCLLYEPFLEWLYQQPWENFPHALPDLLDLPQAPGGLFGYRRGGSGLATYSEEAEAFNVQYFHRLFRQSEGLLEGAVSMSDLSPTQVSQGFIDLLSKHPIKPHISTDSFVKNFAAKEVWVEMRDSHPNGLDLSEVIPLFDKVGFPGIHFSDLILIVDGLVKTDHLYIDPSDNLYRARTYTESKKT
jgi:hypothetical protein